MSPDPRNDILHYGAMFEGDNPTEGIVSDMLRKPKASVRDIPVSVDTLADLAADTQTAIACINFAMMDGPGLPEIAKTVSKRSADAPWKYKPA